ncbi:methyltransferase [Nonomuraea sp. NPDC049421]|uniref:methyltransferase n=1 Tax=Nonomuraea sp. NPDC049421 TaxID=3155275 RepID=UPI0034165BD2
MADDGAHREVLAKLTGAWLTQAVAAMAELGLADRLDERPLTCGELARACGVHAGALFRLLRLLESHDLVEQGTGGAYALTPTGALLSSRHPDSLADLALFYAGPFYASWGALPYAVRTGRQGFEHVYGKPFFDHTAEHPEMGAAFDRAMACGSSFFTQLPQVYDFTRHRHVVDVGGGRGALLAAVLAQVEGVRGTLFDGPGAVERGRAALTEAGLADRCDFAAGDFFAQVPSGGDVYLLSRILHDWDDEPCARVLANCRAAMPAGGRLLVLERLVPERPHDAPGALAIAWDVHMLVNNGAGRERTYLEYERLLAGAGFALEDVRGLPLDVNVLVARA